MADYTEQGISGLNRFGGIVYEEWLRELQGTNGIRVYREMRDNDAIIGAFLYAIEMLVRQVAWRVKPASDDQVDIDNAQFVDECLHDMETGWNDTISEILSFLTYGWAWMEQCYKLRKGPDAAEPHHSKFNDGKVGWRKWGIRAQNTLSEWKFNDTGEVQGMTQVSPPDFRFRYIPMAKSLLFRTQSHQGNPEGRSLLRNAYRSWFFKKNMEEIEAIGIERDLAGFPIMWIPPEIFAKETAESTAAYNMYKKIITNIKRDEQEGLMLPLSYDDRGNKQYDMTMLSSGNTRRQFDTDVTIRRYEQRIAITVMADFLLIGHTQAGSYALSDNKTSLFQKALGTILQNICDVINMKAIPDILALNNIKPTIMPIMTHDAIENVDITALGNFIKNVVGVGGIQTYGDLELEDSLRDAAKLPKRPKNLPDKPLPVTNPGTNQAAALDDEPTIEKDIEYFMEAIKQTRDQLAKEGMQDEN